MSVVVDYQGPKAFEAFASQWNIPIFDRVKSLRYEFRNLDQIKLDDEDVAKMTRLQEIVIAKKSSQKLTAEDARAAEGLIPACRLVSSTQADNKISLALRPGAPFEVCPSSD